MSSEVIEGEVVEQEQTAIVKSDGRMLMRPADVRQQVNDVQELMKSVMQAEQHYGVIPGTGNKPSLLQPGAQKLMLAFGFAPTYQVERREFDNGHREYEVTCRLLHRNSGSVIGEGLGVASTMESRYRYRWVGSGANRHKVDHPDPADNWNTVKKMASKRALVHAVITATAASDIFTQDVEDMPEFAGQSATPRQSGEPARTQPERTQGGTAAAAPRPAAAAPASNTGDGVAITKCETKQGETNGRAWTRYWIELSDGRKGSTMDNEIGQAALQAMDTGEAVHVTTEKNGKFTNITSVTPVDAGEPSNATSQQAPAADKPAPQGPTQHTIEVQKVLQNKLAGTDDIVYLIVDEAKVRYGTLDKNAYEQAKTIAADELPTAEIYFSIDEQGRRWLNSIEHNPAF